MNEMTLLAGRYWVNLRKDLFNGTAILVDYYPSTPLKNGSIISLEVCYINDETIQIQASTTIDPLKFWSLEMKESDLSDDYIEKRYNSLPKELRPEFGLFKEILYSLVERNKGEINSDG